MSATTRLSCARTGGASCAMRASYAQDACAATPEAAASENGRRRLRHVVPELGIVAEEDLRPRRAQRPQALERPAHRLRIVDDRGQVQIVEGAAEVAGVGREHDRAALVAHAK